MIILDKNINLDDLFSQELIVYEDIKGIEILVKWNLNGFEIKTDLNSDIINMSDEYNLSYYNKAVSYFNSLDDRIKSLIPKKWWFCFQYFPDMENNYIYNKKAKNNLVLCFIYKNDKCDFIVEEIEEFSRLLNVECLPFIFKGRLSEKSIESIKYFLHTSEKDIEYVFGETSFPYFIFKLLNPQLSNSFLMNNEFNVNIEKFIIKINVKEESFAILNPLYKKVNEDNNTEYSEIFSLIIINFMNFCQSINLDELKLKGDKRDEIYTYIICILYNNYISSVKEDILKFEFIIPEFFNKDKFRINKGNILNKITREFINENKKFEYIFKCIYFSFRYKMKESIGLLEGNLLKIFNKFIEDINARIDTYFNKKSEIELSRRGLIDFGNFVDIAYDGDKKVYPEIVDDIKKNNSKKKKGLGFDKSDLNLIKK